MALTIPTSKIFLLLSIQKVGTCEINYLKIIYNYCHIFILARKQNIFAALLKGAVVTPIFKSGEVNDIKNYAFNLLNMKQISKQIINNETYDTLYLEAM